MRQSKREVRDPEDLRRIMAACDVCRVAFAGDGFPYIVPMNFGEEWFDGRPVLYFHCAREGRKLDLLRRDPRVGLEMDTARSLVSGERACRYSMNYESLIGEGTIRILEDPARRIHGLQRIMAHYTGRADWGFDPHDLSLACVLRLDVSSLCGKRLAKPASP